MSPEVDSQDASMNRRNTGAPLSVCKITFKATFKATSGPFMVTESLSLTSAFWAAEKSQGDKREAHHTIS